MVFGGNSTDCPSVKGLVIHSQLSPALCLRGPSAEGSAPVSGTLCLAFSASLELLVMVSGPAPG